MRMELPRCDFKRCTFFFDGNCTTKRHFEQCDYQRMKTTLESIMSARKLCVLCGNAQCKNATTDEKICDPIWNGTTV